MKKNRTGPTTKPLNGKKQSGRKLFQLVWGACALIPIIAGLLGMSGIDNPIYLSAEKPAGLLLDSNLRFLNGLSVGIGVYSLSIIPNIRKRSGEVKMICLVIFFGGIGRAISAFNYGFPPVPFNLFVFFELALPPLLAFWHSRICGGKEK